MRDSAMTSALPNSNPLLNLTGAPTSKWSLSGEDARLTLEGTAGELHHIGLSTEQIQSLRSLAGRADNLTLEVELAGEPVALFMAGQKVGEQSWAGFAALAQDLDSIVKILENNILFAEQVVSEVNSLVVILDRQGRLKRFNRLCEEMSGLREADLIGKDALEFLVSPEEARLVRTNIDGFFHKLASYETERAVHSEKSGPVLVKWRNKLVKTGTEDQWYLVCSGTDISEERRAKEAEAKQARALKESENLHRSVVASINSGIVLTNEAGQIVTANPAAERILEMSLSEVEGHAFRLDEQLDYPGQTLVTDTAHTLSGEAVLDRKICVRMPDGSRKKWLNYSRELLVREGETIPHAVLHTFDDVTAEHEAQERLIVLANTDTLTGLPNRHAMQERISELLARNPLKQFGVLFLDLDNFKAVNDHFGHAQGDELIKLAAREIRSRMRPEDVLARLGGDEFLIIIDHPTSLAELESLAERILEHMKKPFRLDASEIYSTCSIGIALCPEHGTTRDELIRNADTAMYVAKDAGKHTYRVFTPEMNNRVKEYMWLDTNFRRALEEQQFELHYQPKIDIHTGELAGVEALIRWRSPERGMVSPVSFIPYAEESGLIVPMGRWVLETAAAQAREWLKQGWKFRVAVNLSARQLRDSDVLKDLNRVLDAVPECRPLIDVELTESMLVEDEATAVTLINAFRAMGVEVHLDDFGTGYSSLSQLARLPMDVIKMDRSFINSIHEDAKARALVRTIAAAAKELSVKIVAEGVETYEQAEFLRSVNVDYVQGYLYSKPLPAAELEAWLAANHRSRRSSDEPGTSDHRLSNTHATAL
jgi:cyclic di-GMP phosphodiesterase Gmr